MDAATEPPKTASQTIVSNSLCVTREETATRYRSNRSKSSGNRNGAISDLMAQAELTTAQNTNRLSQRAAWGGRTKPRPSRPIVERMPHPAIATNHVAWRWICPACPPIRTASKGTRNAYIPSEASTGRLAANTAAVKTKAMDSGIQSTRANLRLSEHLE